MLKISSIFTAVIKYNMWKYWTGWKIHLFVSQYYRTVMANNYKTATNF